MRITIVPWFQYDKWYDGTTPREIFWAPDAGGGRRDFGRFSTFDLRPYGLPDAILVTPDYNRRLLQEGGKRLDLGEYLDRKLGSVEAKQIGERLGVNATAGMTVGASLRLLIEPGLIAHRDGKKHAWLHTVDLMDDSTAAGG